MKGWIFLGAFLFSVSYSLQSYSSQLCKALQPNSETYFQNIADTDSPNHLNFQNLKLLVWNVYKGAKQGLYTDINILTQNTDLGLFQEAYLNHTFESLICSRLDLNWGMARSFADKNGVYAGVMTSSRQNPSFAYALMSPNTEPFSDIHKMMLVSLYSIPNRLEKLMVINLHGINFVPQSYFENQINVIVSAIRSHRGPILVAGDFNSYTKGRTQFLLKAMKGVGLMHAKVLGNEYQGIFILDHLFFRGFELTKIEVLKDVTTSDHKPLYFELRLLKK